MGQTTTLTHQLVIIDSRVNNYQSLVSDVSPDSTVLIIDSSSDGLTQISDYLTTLPSKAFQSIHIISHGGVGSLLLGSNTVTGSNLGLYSKQLATLGNALTDTGDILLYGCNVAAGDIGQRFIEDLAGFTGADVAASDDLTGAAGLRGDWVLEAATGAIDSSLALSATALNGYAGILATYTGTINDDTIKGSNADDTLNGGAGNDKLWGGIGTDTADFVGNRADYQLTTSYDGTLNITDLNAANGNEGVDSLSGIETLKFADGSYSLSLAATTEIQVNTFTTGNQYNPTVAGLKNGGYVVAYMSNNWAGMGNWEIVGQLYNADGSKQGGEFQVNTYNASYEDQPTVIGLSDGGFMASWETYYQGSDSGDGVAIQRFSANGSKQGAEIQVNTYTTGFQGLVDITELTNGTTLVTWTSDGQDGSSSGVYGQLIATDGSRIGSEFQINSTTANAQEFNFTSALPDGGFYVVWQSNLQDGSGYGIYGQRYDANGVASGSETLINTTTANAQTWPTISVLLTGEYIITWESALQDSSGMGIYAQRFSASGSKIGSEVQINAYTTNDQSSPEIITLTSGRYVIAWNSSGEDGDLSGVYARIYAEDGTALGTPFRVNTTTASDQTIYSWGNRQLSPLEDGGFVVAWSSNNQDGSQYGVYSQRFDADGRPTGTPTLTLNYNPTLTTFNSTVGTGDEDTEATLTFANLQTQGDESDADGTVTAFVVKAVSSGSLKIGLSAATATAWNASSNNTIDDTHQAYWTPDANANGTLNAFTAVAKDNIGVESATAVQATVSVAAVPDVNVVAGVTPVEGGVTGTFTVTLDSPAPAGGLTVNYTLAGTATLSTDYTVTAGSNITAVTGSSFTIAAGQTSATLNVSTLGDAVSDAGETVSLNLASGSGYQLAQSSSTTFGSKVDYTTGTNPYSISQGDFNNDGKTDLAVANWGSNSVSIFLRNSANTDFEAKTDYSVGSNPHAVTTGDFNNDGKVDLAVANYYSNTVSVLLRNAANTGFDPKVDYITSVTPGSIIGGDFNGDGKLDLAITSYNGTTVSVLMRNAGNSGFDNKIDYATGSNPISVSAGDFNNDGRLDLVVANQFSNTVSVLLRNSINTDFDPKVDYAMDAQPYSVNVGDFNNDGKLDIATANMAGQTISVLLRNNSNTGFNTRTDYTNGLYGDAIGTGDFNLDGNLDLAVSNAGTACSVFLQNPTNNNFDTKTDYIVGSNLQALSVGDLNGDGKSDLAVADYVSNVVSILLNTSNPTATLTITNNTAPTITAPTATTFTEQTATAIASTLTLNDADGDSDWNNGSLKVQITANNTASDNLILPTTNNGSIWLNTSGNVLMSNTTAIGTADAATVSNGSAWTFIFNSAATNALVQSAARAIQFNNNSDTPSTNARTVTFTATDKIGATSSVNQTLNVTAVNDVPTLTAFTSAVTSGNEDSQLTVTFANLQAQGNEADVDGTVTAFVVKAVSSGTLKIGLSASTATAWNASTNNSIDATHQAYWTPAANANGTVDAFTAVAKDDGGLESATAVQATVSVAAVPDVTVVSGITPVEGGTVGTFTVTLDSAAPVGGLTVNYALAGTATLSTDYTVTAGSNITAVTGSSFTIAAGQTSATLNVNAVGDAVADPSESVNFNLTAGTGYQLATGSLSFGAKVDYATGVAPKSVCQGDFNNDGKVDLAIANWNSDTVSVLLRNATNTGFDAKVDYATDSGPYSASVGDFNNDGKLDLALVNIIGSTVSVLLRNAANTGFDAKVDYTTGSTPYSVGVGDFNNDGKLDLATANYNGNSVSVLLRNAANTGFDAKADYVTGSGFGSESVSAGDFNNDGKLDLVVANYNTDTISVFPRNVANTGFDTKVDYATGFGPESVSVGDFNNDGKLDLAVANYNGNTVSVLLRNDANTGFNAKVDYATGFGPESVSVGDFNNDGKLDLAVANYDSNTVSVLLRNDANTGFNAKVDYATGFGPGSVSVGDFNSDGRVDLALADYISNTVSVLLNNSNPTATLTITNNSAPSVVAGTTTIFTEQTPIAVTSTITINDIDGNADWNGGTLKVQITSNNTASDSLTLPTTNNGGIWLNSTGNVLMSNTTAIGTANAATVSNGSAWTFTFNSAATNALVQSTAQAIQFTNNSDAPNTSSRTVTFTATDKNGGSGLATQTVSVTAVNDAPTLTAFSSTVTSGNEDNQLTVTFANLQTQGNEADVDGSVTSFTVKAISTGSLKIGLSAATATAWNATTNNTIDTTHQAYWTPAANANGTLNAFTAVAKDDGGLESATTVQATVSVAAVSDVTVAAGVTPVEGGTTGTFTVTLDGAAPVGGLTVNYTLAGTATLSTDYTVTAGSNITAVTGSSFTIAAGQTSATLNVNAVGDAVSDPSESVNFNLAAGTGYQFVSNMAAFSPKVDYATGPYPQSISVGDFNNDGRPDLAVGQSNNTVSVLLRNAANTDFDTKVDYATGSSTISVSNGDFNNDGKLDLAIENFNNGVSVLLRNTGNTGFDPYVDYATDLNPFSVSTGDFNADGKDDVVTANWASNTVSVLLRNAANSGFDAKTDYATGSGPSSVNVGDFNNDGKLDLVVANYMSNTVSVFLRNATNTAFDTRVDYATGTSPTSVNLGDFNNDGKLDVVAANSQSNTVSVLLRNTNNTGFDDKIDYATNSVPESVAVSDFNNDGKIDLAISGHNNTVSVLLRNAANTGFDDKIDYAIEGSDSYWVSAGDFNNDDKIDLAVANSNTSSVSLLLNNSNPTATLTITNNTAPTIVAGTTTLFTEQTPITVASTITINDTDGNTDWNGGNLKIQITANNTASDSLLLPITNNGGIWLNTVGNVLMSNTTAIGTANAASVSNGSAWTFTFNSVATNTLVQSAAQSIQFTNNSDVPSTSNRTTTFTATDKNGNAGLATQTVSVTSVNDAPTLTAFSSALASGNEDNQIAVTFANLQNQGNEADIDGTVTAFTVKAVSTGSLKIGLSSATATAWNATSNNTIDATHQAYWTPAANANGTLNAFTAVAKDDGGLESATAVQAAVSVAPANDAPSGAVTVSGTTGLGQILTASNTLADADGLGSLNYQWQSSSDGTVWGAISGATATTFTLTSSQLGKQVRATVSYTDNQGTSESMASNTLLVPADTSAPTLASSTPADNATAVAASANIILAFSETVQAGSGNIVISNGSDTRTIAVTDLSQVTLSGSTVTINPTANLNFASSYNVQMANGVIKDLAGNAYVGIADAATLNFATAATPNTAPTATNLSQTITYTEDTATAIADMVVTDPDANTFSATVSLAGGNSSLGALTAGSGNGETYNAATGVWSVTGSKASVNAALAAVSFVPVANGFANTSAAVSISDGIAPAITGTLTINGTAVNDAPTLTSFASTVASGNEDNQIIVTFANLQSQGNDTDADGTVTAFTVKTVSTGSLKIGLSAATATAWNATTNNTIDATHQAYWTPAANANGTLNAFTVVAKDDGGLESSTAIQTSISIAAVNDAPSGAVTVSGTTGLGQTLTAANTLTDADGLGSLNYQWQSSTDGTVWGAISGATATTFTLTSSQLGKQVRAIVSYTDNQGTSESMVSNTLLVPEDTGAPTLASSSPADNAASVAASANIVLTFSETVQAGSGNIVISNGTDTRTIAITDSSQVTLSGNTVTINPTADLNFGGSYNVQMTNGAIKDLAGNAYVGISDAATLNFATAAMPNTAPTATNLSQTISYTEDTAAAIADMVVTDPDANTFTATVSLAGGNSSMGSLTAGSGNGETYNAATGVWSVTGSKAAVNAALAALSFVPAANGFTNTSAAVSVSDGVAAAITGTLTINGTAVNDAPTAANKTVSINEDNTYTFSAADFGYADLDGNAMASVKITSLPSAGSLKLGATAVTLNQTLVVASIANLTFTPTADAYGAGYSSFNFTVNDGNLDSASTKAISFNIAEVNDGPTGNISITGSAIKGQKLTLSNTLADVDGLGIMSYQWQADNANIGVGNSYTLTSNEVGKAIKVIANYTDGLGHTETVNSPSTAAVANSPGFTINPLTLQSTGENGATASYTIQINTAPLVSQNVVLTFTSNNTFEGVVDTPTLTFTSANWSSPQTLTVRGVDDVLNDGSIPYQVTVNVATLDVYYKTIPINAFNLTNADDGLDTPLDIYGDQGGSKVDILQGNNGADKLHGLNMADNLSGGLGNDSLWGGYGDDNLFGEGGNDFLRGEQESDYMEGGDGNDTLDGGEDSDTMIGGAGNDTYYLGYDAPDFISDNGSPTDIDTVIMPYQLTSYTLPPGIENGTITAGTQDSDLAGNTSNNNLTGNNGNNDIDGGQGTDKMQGGKGNDVYHVDNPSDVVIETGGEGADTVVASIDYTLAGNVENLDLGTGDIDGTGNTLANTIDGSTGSNNIDGGDGADTIIAGAGNDTVSGGIGADSLDGGTGNDIYYVDNSGDIVIETAVDAADKVIETINAYTLPDNIENLGLGTGAITGVGNALANTIDGNTGNNNINGGGGADTIIGGAGNDTVSGGGDADSLNGGTGNDVYYVDNSADVVTEAAGEGTDKVVSAVNYTLGATLENLDLNGAAAINGTGNDANNTIIGNTAANTLNGGLGNDSLNGGAGTDTVMGGIGNDTVIGGGSADSLVGGAGNDIYFIDNSGDVVKEVGGEGIDKVVATVDYTLPVNLENLDLDTGATQGVGNILPNLIDGNAGNNDIDGGQGADTMLGGVGDDVYRVDNLGDLVSEIASEGAADKVVATIDGYLLADNIENLDLAKGVHKGTGNALDNVIQANDDGDDIDGGDGNDLIKGGKGKDHLKGNGGDDHIDGGDGDDEIVGGAGPGNDFLKGGNGNDTVFYQSAITGITVNLALGTANGNEIDDDTLEGIENVTGGQAGDIITGAADDNVINGFTGDDSITGGGGNDTFRYDPTIKSGTDSILDFLPGDHIQVIGANFSNAVASGSGSTAGLNQVQLSSVGGITTLSIGTDATLGADLSIKLTGSFGTHDFYLNGTDIQLNNKPTGNIAIGGIATQGQTLTVTNSLADADGVGTFSYQWKANGTPVGTNSSYTLTQAEVGKTITLTASYTDGHGTAESVTSTERGPVANVNDAPTLTAFGATIASGKEDSPIAVNFTSLQTKGNEYDVDGTVTSFVVKAISSGSLKIGADATSATTWNAASNNTVDASHIAYWTPALNANGTLNALTVAAKDNSGAVSATPVQAKIAVTPANDAPVLTTPAIINYTDTVYDDTFPTRTGTLMASDVDKDTLTYGITGGIIDNINGTVSKTGSAGKLTVDRATGAYSFVPNDAVFEALKTSASASFAVTVSDGLLLSSKTLALKISQSGATESIYNDTLSGTSANNKFDGLAGNDIINGLAGADTLKGGLGADQFKFGAVAETGITATTRDIIVDFNHNQGDKIDLSAIDANTKLLGDNAFSAPTVGLTFSGVFTSPGQLYFDKTAHILYGNNDADSTADFSIELTGANNLVAGDFML